MSAATLIPVANDNRPAHAAAAAPRAPLPGFGAPRDTAARSLPEAVAATAEARRSRRNRADATRAIALLYQFILTAFVIYGIVLGLQPFVVAVAALLAALGGVCALAGGQRPNWLGRLVRAVSATAAGLCASFALILLLPATHWSGSQDPMLLAALVFASVGAVFRVPFAALIALAGLGLVVVQLPILSLPLNTAVQVGCILALVAMGALRSRSRLVGLLVIAALAAAGWTAQHQYGLHVVQSLGTLAFGGAALWASGQLLSSDNRASGLWAEAGRWGLLLAALGVQLALRNPVIADPLLQPGPPVTAVAGLLIALQGIVLAANLLRWLGGRIGWLGVVLPQGALALAAFAIISPGFAEAALALPWQVGPAEALSAMAGLCVASIAAFAAWRHWLADNPVRTGLYALVLMVQAALLVGLSQGSLELLGVLAAALAGGVCAVRLCRPLSAMPA